MVISGIIRRYPRHGARKRPALPTGRHADCGQDRPGRGRHKAAGDRCPHWRGASAALPWDCGFGTIWWGKTRPSCCATGILVPPHGSTTTERRSGRTRPRCAAAAGRTRAA